MQFLRGNLSNEELVTIYQNLLWPRLIEEKMLVLLRQGKISKWFSGIGQEAISVGATLALEDDEWIMPFIETSAYLLHAKCLCINYFSNGRAARMDIAKEEKEVFILEAKNIISAA